MIKQVFKIIFILVFILFTAKINYAQIEQEQIYKFNQVIETISNFYVDSVDESKLIKKAIIASLEELDPHSVYFDKEELEELNRGLKGSFVGVGITYDIINDTVLILSVSPRGPSEIAGILPGDRIIKVENEVIAGTGIDDDKLKNLLTGKKGSKVDVSVKRQGHKKTILHEITRNNISVNSIDAAYKVNDEIAYIKLNRFSATSIKEFEDVVKRLSIIDSDKLILDLRGNSGGYLYVSVKLLENFLKKKSSVLYTKGVHKSEKEYITHENGKFRNSDLVILINEGSASASEIVSGAIQDWDRGVIVGRRSYGKGLVQKPFYLVDGSMIRLTIAKYYTPSGRNIQKPYNNGTDEYNHEIADRLERGELMNKDSIKHIDTLKYYTLNNKRVIYGGGGIMPDIFIELDTMKYPLFYKEFLNIRKTNEFVHLYIEKNRDFFKSTFPNFEVFSEEYMLDRKIIEELVIYLYEGDENKLGLVDELSGNDYVMSHLKALIAYDVWGENEYYKIINEKDKSFIKAIEIISDNKKYSEILQNDIIGDYIEK